MIRFGVTGERQLPVTDQSTRNELMSELLQAPLCEKHGCQKVRKQSKKNGKHYEHWHCPECAKARALKHWRNNKAQYKSNLQRWRANNPEKRAEQVARESSVARAMATSRWQKANPEHQLAFNALRRARLFNAVKGDETDKAITDWLYKKAKDKGLSVDHIQPLRFQGEHAPWNLQLLSRVANSQKHCKLPTLKEVMRGERRYRLLRRLFVNVGTAAA